jgi:hypothetical protein
VALKIFWLFTQNQKRFLFLGTSTNDSLVLVSEIPKLNAAILTSVLLLITSVMARPMAVGCTFCLILTDLLPGRLLETKQFLF